MLEMLRKGYFFLVVFLNLFVNNIFAQFNNFQFEPPLEIPMYLSGNFCEIRSNHFHTGIDIKTQGVTGHKVYSISDGYISRIKVQANGYGKALYITHNNGYTSVYCHLDRFRDDIQNYVLEQQYKQKSFEIDLYLDKNTFQVSKKEFVAFTGNSGGSSGPHLHFEIRDQNQQPMNVLRFNIDIRDEVAPKFKHLIIYPCDDGEVNDVMEKYTLKTIKDNENYTIPDQVVHVNGHIGFGVEVFDYLNGMPNRCGVYSLELFVDDELINQFQMNTISFNVLRYINAHIDYEERIKHNLKVHRLYKLPNNRLEFDNYYKSDGIVRFEDTLVHKIQIIARDAYDNSSSLNFSVRSSEKSVNSQINLIDENDRLMRYNQRNTYILNDLKIDIPQNALYEDIHFNYIKIESDTLKYKVIHHIHDETVPLHKYISISIKPKFISPEFHNKTCIMRINKGNNLEYVGGKLSNGFIEAETRDFGNFVLMVDTTPPVIRPINFGKESIMKQKKELKVRIFDEESDIQSYTVYIDDQWAMFDYDKKNDLISHELDQSRFGKNQWHDLKIIVQDNLNNINEFSSRFYW